MDRQLCQASGDFPYIARGLPGTKTGTQILFKSLKQPTTTCEALLFSLLILTYCTSCSLCEEQFPFANLTLVQSEALFYNQKITWSSLVLFNQITEPLNLGRISLNLHLLLLGVLPVFLDLLYPSILPLRPLFLLQDLNNFIGK